jgi:hypothetical protein
VTKAALRPKIIPIAYLNGKTTHPTAAALSAPFNGGFSTRVEKR